eukprot:357747-Chlamydomonas_euryale.AAC.2
MGAAMGPTAGATMEAAKGDKGSLQTARGVSSSGSGSARVDEPAGGAPDAWHGPNERSMRGANGGQEKQGRKWKDRGRNGRSEEGSGRSE